MPRSILVVDDNQMNRQMLSRMLCDDYEIIEAANGREALEVMERMSQSLSAVLLDLAMPEMDGYALLKLARERAELSLIPIIITTASTEVGAEVKALALGANDYITKPYNHAVIRHRLRNTIKLRETAASLNAAMHDRLTGLLNRETFFDRAGELIAEREPGYYVMSSCDVDNFKVINDQYGSARGDKVLKHIADTLRRGFGAVGGLCCRIMADNFAVLYPRSFVDTEMIEDIRRLASSPDESMLPLTISIGRYIVEDLSLSVSAMYDRATMAESSVRRRYDEHVAQYDESMRQRLLREQAIVNRMKGALESGQFEVWFQPQYNHSTGELVGAEALVRWRDPETGRLIPPLEFIPVFERNGFIYEMDKFVWEQTCAVLRRWLDEGRSPLPISVNISRYDVFRKDFFRFITDLVEKYAIPIDLLRLEITESAFAKSTEQIVTMVKRLIDFGFAVEIDDFGSGYSSLNTLKDVPASILKLDMRFLEQSENPARGGNILGSIVRMAKWLGMTVIAEGVETREQADYLKSIGCMYMQGYLYARPMPLDEYERLADAKGEVGVLTLEKVSLPISGDFFDPCSLDTLVFNSYVGGASIFEFHGETLEMLRVNDKYARLLGGSSVERALEIAWEDYMEPGGREKLFSALGRAIESGGETVDEVALTGLNGSSRTIYLRSTMRVIANTGDRYLFYCMIDDITDLRESEKQNLENVARLRELGYKREKESATC